MVKLTENSPSAPKHSKQNEKKHVKKNAKKEGVIDRKEDANASSVDEPLKTSKDFSLKEKNSASSSSKDSEKDIKSEGSKRKSFVIFLWFLGMIMLVLMGALYWEATEEGKNVSVVSSEVSDLASSQETQEMRIKKLEENQIILKTRLEKIDLLEKEFVQSQSEMSALNGRLNAVEGRNPKVILPPDASILVRQGLAEKAQVHHLEERVAEIEKMLLLRNKAGKEGLKVMQIFSNLQQALLTGHPFEEELKALFNETNQSDETLQRLLKSLKPFASEGIPTPVDLYLLFPNVADKISTALRPEPQNFGEKILARIKNLVSVRRIKGGSFTKETSDGVLVSIEQVLAYGDLKRALEMMKKVDIKGDAEALAWITSAEQYLNAQKILSEIEGYIFGSAFGEIKGVNLTDNKGLSKGVSQ